MRAKTPQDTNCSAFHFKCPGCGGGRTVLWIISSFCFPPQTLTLVFNRRFIYCLRDSQPGPPRSVGGPMKSLFLLFANWREVGGHKKMTQGTSPLYIFIILVRVPVINTQSLCFGFYRFAKCSYRITVVKLYNHSSSPTPSSGLAMTVRSRPPITFEGQRQKYTWRPTYFV